MPTASEEIQDEIVHRDILIDRYRRRQAQEVLAMLARLEEDIIARIQALDPSLPNARKRARLARVLADIQRRVDRYGKALDQKLMPALTELARDEAEYGVRQLSTVPPVALDVVTPTNAMVEAAVAARPFQGRLLKDWVADHPAGVRMRLRQAITQGVVEGATIQELVRRVRGTRANAFRDGIMEVNRRGAEALVRTAVNHTVTMAREEVYLQNEDIIKGVKWVSTLDSRTSLTCMDLDGKVFPQDRGPRPPAHINCRSTTVPVLKSWKELGINLPEAPVGTRASMDGQVPASLTYGDWLRRQPAAFQDDVLGPARAQMFREGADIGKFVDNSGRAYTLAQLRGATPAPRPARPTPTPPAKAPAQPTQTRDLSVTRRDMRDEGWDTSRDFHDSIGGFVEASEEGMELWNKHLKADPTKLIEELTGPLMVSTGSRTFGVGKNRAGHLYSQFMTEVYDPVDGAHMGSLTRTFRKDPAGLAVHHDYLRLNPRAQGAGAGTAALRSQFEAYRRMGIKTVDVHAALDKGGYVWAKFGFKPYQESWDVLRGGLRRTIQQMHKHGRIDKSVHDEVVKILQDPNPEALWEISDLTHIVTSSRGQGEVKLGWDLLAGNSWKGEIKLDDKVAMDRFNRYVNRKK